MVASNPPPLASLTRRTCTAQPARQLPRSDNCPSPQVAALIGRHAVHHAVEVRPQLVELATKLARERGLEGVRFHCASPCREHGPARQGSARVAPRRPHQRQGMPQAIRSSGQPRAISRLCRVCRLYRACFRPRRLGA